MLFVRSFSDDQYGHLDRGRVGANQLDCGSGEGSGRGDAIATTVPELERVETCEFCYGP